jgi:hypothetical protein
MSSIPDLYRQDQFQARKHMLKLLGASFDLRTMDGRLLAYSKQKAFRLREDIRVFADEAQTVELLLIKADRIVDWSASYHVTDSQTGEPIGSLRRKGWSSMVRDSWEILDPEGVVRAHVLEDSSWKAMLRRVVDFAALFLPQTYLIQVNGQTLATMRQNFMGIPPKFHVDLTHDTNDVLPRPLAVATVILLLAIEGRQTGLT